MSRLPTFRRHAIAAAALVAMAPCAWADTFTWSSGSFVPGGTAPSPLGAADVLNIETGGAKFFNGLASNFINGGTVNWNADPLYFQGGTTVVNNALWNATGDQALVYNGGAAPSFTNNGIFRKSGGIGNTTISHIVGFVNNGTLDAQTGSINFVGGSVFNAGSVFTGTGIVNVSAGTNTFNGAFTSSNLLLSGGTHSGNGAVVGGTVAFTGGYLAGTWQVGAGQTLQGQAGGAKFIEGAGTVVTNQGTIDWNTANSLYLQSGAKLVNQALFLASESAAVTYNGGAGPVFDNTAGGTVRAAAGKTLTINNTVGFINNGGALDAQVGATIHYAGGTVFNADTKFTGAGTNVATGNNSWSGAFNSANLVLQGGTHTGSGAAVGGTVAFAGGNLAGTWQVGAGQTLQGQAGGAKFIEGAATVVTNQGTIDWNTANSLYLQGGAKLVNQALFLASESSALTYNGGAGPMFDNTASGTVRAAAGKTLTINNIVGFVNNGGVLDAQAGAVIHYAGGSQFMAGTQFTGAGTNQATGGNSWSGTFDSANLVLQSGAHTGNGAVIGGTVAFTGGYLAGTWQVGAGQTLQGQAGGAKFIEGAGTVVTNQGTIDWNTSNSLYLQGGAKLDNQGRLNFSDDAGVTYNGGSLPTFVNTGLIVKSGGTGTTSIGNTLAFDNLGTIDVQTGTIALPINFTNNGTLTGTGAFAAAGTLTNAGHVAPGASPGALTVKANLVLGAPGSLDIEVQSLASHDLLVVNGNTSLGGTLAVSCFGACSFAVGEEFRVLDGSGTLLGSFSGLTRTGFGSGNFDIVYDRPLGDVWLRVTETVTAVPEPETYALMLGGLAVVGWLARRRRT